MTQSYIELRTRKRERLSGACPVLCTKRRKQCIAFVCGDVYNYTPYHINHQKGGSTGLIKEDSYAQPQVSVRDW